jgi:biotin carboxylase
MLMDRAIIFVTAGRWQVPAIKMAMELGFCSIAIDSNPNAPGLKIADHSIIAELDDIEEIIESIDSLEIVVAGVLSYCSEVGVLTASKIREHYKLEFPNPEQVFIFLDKSLQRKKLDEEGFKNPKWQVIDNAGDIDFKGKNFKFPLVVKPPDSSGSRGVSVVNSLDELEEKINKAAVFSKNKKIIIEEFIDGTEFTVEVKAEKGKIDVLLVTKKFKISNDVKTVAVELWSVNPNDEIFSRLSKLAKKVFHAFGLQTGIGHLEALVTSTGEIYIVEAAIRGGGFNLANKMVIFSTGFDLCKWSIKNETKSSYDAGVLFYKPSVLFFQPTTNGIIKKISGIYEVNGIEGVYVEQLITEGTKLDDAETDADRIYCAVVASDSSENLQIKKEKVQNMIKVEIL